MKKISTLWIAMILVVFLVGCVSRSELTSTEFWEIKEWEDQEEICKDELNCESESSLKVGQGNNTFKMDEASMAEYCVDKGWKIKVEEDMHFCMFKDETYCEIEDFFTGECKEGEIIYNVSKDKDSTKELVMRN